MIIYTEHDFEDDIELDRSTSVLSLLGVHIAHWPRAEGKFCAVHRGFSVRKGIKFLKLTEGSTPMSIVQFH